MSLLLIGCAAPGASAPEARAPVEVSEVAEPLDTIVTVGSLRLHMVCQGVEPPTIVFEAGLGVAGRSWAQVAQRLSTGHRFCVYDRAGLGLSGPPPVRHGQHSMATELHALLETTEQRAPYVMVGHSMGGAIVRWFAADHPDEVAGMILVDPATEDWPDRVLPTVPLEEHPAFWANIKKWEGIEPADYIAGYRDLRDVPSTLGNRPLMILTAELPADTLALRQTMHDALRRLSTNVVSEVVPNSGHMVPLDAPDAIATAVSRVAASAKSGKAL